MSLIRASQSALIPAPPRVVYSLIADYRGGHPRMLPPRYFPRLEVERGGSGAGTIIRFEFKLLGATRHVRAEISEPAPGEELVETDLATGARTTFRVVAREGARESEVTIETEWETNGFRGWLEKMLVPPLFRRIYALQLAQLAALCAEATAPSGASRT